MLFKNRLDKLHQRAAHEVKNREYVNAQNTYLECFALDPKDIGTMNNLAQLSNILGEEDKARGYNEMLLEECDERLKSEKTEELLILKSNALVSLKRNDEAIEVIDELLEISPDHILGLFHNRSAGHLCPGIQPLCHLIFAVRPHLLTLRLFPFIANSGIIQSYPWSSFLKGERHVPNRYRGRRAAHL